jgi:hypothetical protein
MAAMISDVRRTWSELEVGAVCRSRHGRTVLDADNVIEFERSITLPS